MKKFLITFSLLLGILFMNEASAQNYSAAVGLRAGWGLTGTYKTFLNESNALEAYLGIGGLGYGGFTIGAMYQIHKPFEQLGIANLDWYFGGGAFAGTYGSYGFSGNHFFLGINAVLGLDYTFEDYPINLSIDIAPGINIIRGDYAYLFHWPTGGLAVRYVLGD